VALAAAGYAFLPRARTALLAFVVLLALQGWWSPVTHRGGDEIAAAPLPAALRQGQPRTPRNIYLLQFDALVSREAFDQLLRKDAPIGEPPWEKPLADAGMRSVANAFAAGDSTIPSFQRLLALGDDVRVRDFRRYFGGAMPVPGYVAAHKLGYKVQFLYSSSYFGRHVGGHVDHFYPVETTDVCDFVPRNFLLAACSPNLPFLKQLTGADTDDTAARARLLSEIRGRVVHAAKAPQRWLTVAYVWSPGHTLAQHDYGSAQSRRSYAESFAREGARAATIASELVAFIRREDPGAVVVVSGDHGAWVTRGAETSLPRELVDLDHRGVGLFLQPADFCRKRIPDRGYDAGFLLRDLLLCLLEE
jgi:hypothetical protein